MVRSPIVRRVITALAALTMAATGLLVAGGPAQALPGYVTPLKNSNNNGKCLDVATQNNYTVQLWNCTGVQEQKWIYGQPSVIGGVPYLEITNWRNSTCLDVAGQSMDAWVPVVVTSCTGVDSQLWQPYYAGDSTLRVLRNRHSGLCLDLYNDNTANGTIIQQYYCDLSGANPAQVWYNSWGW